MSQRSAIAGDAAFRERHLKLVARAKKKTNIEANAGYVYFAKCEHYIKIGHAMNVDRRMRHLQTGNAREIKLLAAIQGDKRSEECIHEKFAKHRVRGEWFRDHYDLRVFILEQSRMG